MAEGFGDLGIAPALVEAARALGYAAPTPLQAAAVPVLRRGGNAVLHASAGAGVVGAYGLALADRLAAEAEAEGEAEAETEAAGPLRGLVLAPTPDAASRVAASLARIAGAVGRRVAALDPGWARPAREAEFVVATPAAALDAVAASGLKLDGVRALVIDGLSALLSLGAAEALEALTGSVPRDAQRVVVTARRTPGTDDYIERHVRRPLQIPAPAGREPAPAAAPRPVGYRVVEGDARLDALAALLAERAADGRAVVYCRDAGRADAVADALALRGFSVTRDAAGGRIAVLADAAVAADAGVAISYDVPFDAETLARRHAAGGLVLVEPRELEHLWTIADRAGLEPRAEPAPVAAPALDNVAAFRATLERAIAEEDIGAQLLVLDPLFRQHGPAPIAAAASALLRRRAPAPAPAPRPAAAPAAPPPPAYVRLFVGVGARDGIRPGDLVGAITGEADVPGESVGRIEIRDNFSIVEVEGAIAERVIRAVNGTTIKGRSVRVDYDRRGAPERRPAERHPPGERPRRRGPRDGGR